MIYDKDNLRRIRCLLTQVNYICRKVYSLEITVYKSIQTNIMHTYSTQLIYCFIVYKNDEPNTR